MTTPSRRLIALATAALIALAACTGTASPPPAESGAGRTGAGGSNASPPNGSAPNGSPVDVGGSVVVSGSSTVEPITALVAELFTERVSDGVSFDITGPGTSDGFERFCNGETDLSDASRSIRDEEIETCTANGITDIIELKVAIDGLSVITSIENSQVACLTFADLYALLGPESTNFDNWSDAQAIATELGSTTQLPDAPLVVTAPGEESGTFGSFVEIVIESFNEDRDQEATTRPDYSASPNDNVIIEGIAGTPTALGWVGYAFAKENESRVKLLQVDDGESGCVAPTPETIASNEYPISRDLFIYVNKANVDTNPAVAAFVDFYVSEGVIAEVLAEVPYVPLAADALAETQATWRDRAVVGGGS